MAILEVGLTGGIASGKSTVDGIFERLGAQVIDADKLVHGMLRRGSPEHDAVLARFGGGILDDAGEIDRRVLGAIVFSDAHAREDLNAILHPGVRREELRIKDELRTTGGGIVITDAALLVETGRHSDYHRLVVVACDPDLQVTRLLARHPGMTDGEARLRLAAQAPTPDKVAVADYVIETTGSMSDTEEQTARVHQFLVQDLDTLRRGEELVERNA